MATEPAWRRRRVAAPQRRPPLRTVSCFLAFAAAVSPVVAVARDEVDWLSIPAPDVEAADPTPAPAGSVAPGLMPDSGVAVADASAADIAGASPANDTAGSADDEEVKKEEEKRRFQRHLSAGAQVTVAIFFMAGMAVMIAMYFLQESWSKRAELLRAGMDRTMSTDKYLLRILKNFSVKTVEDHIFHGIMPKKTRVTVSFNGLCTTIRGGRSLPFGKMTEDKRILTGVTGRFEAGHVAAIMGTSGAGKTTFLNLLCGKISAMGSWDISGQVYVNDEPAELSSLKNVMGFVPQDDVVHERMTVRENFRFSAELRNPAGTSKNRLQRITDDVLQVLQLEAQQNIRVGNRTTGGGLSGGQRKRVNVGLELAACPTLLFLDEPTSGLDATGSLMLVRQLQKMTQLGMTIIMVIHQPRYSLFTLIDDVLLLGKGGRTAFIGPTEDAKRYFETLGFTMPANENPADWMMDVMSGQNEISNANIAPEELPERLFKEWENRAADWKNGAPDLAAGRLAEIAGRVARTATFNRETSEVEDSEVIKSHLKEAWRRVDPPATTALNSEQFSEVLAKCTGVSPEKRVVDDLMARIASAALHSTGNMNRLHVKDHVTHLEFERYLMAVFKGGPALRMMTSTCVMEDVQEEDDDADMTETEDEDDEDEVDGTATEGSMSSGQEDVESQQGRLRRPTRMSNTSKSRTARGDLHRVLPGFWHQIRIVITVRSIQWWRRQTMRLMFLVVVEFAAVFLGVFDRWVFKNPPWLPTNFMNAQISLALLTSVYSLSTFGSVEELPVFWRECSHGLNRAAYFLGRSIVDFVDLFLLCFGFATLYYIVMAPAMTFYWYIIPFIFVCWVACGWGYMISCWLPYELISLGPFISALLSFVFGGILGLPTEMGVYLSNPMYEIVVDAFAFTRWGVAMEFFKYIEHSPPDLEHTDIQNKFFYQMSDRDYKLGWKLPGDDNYYVTGCIALGLIGLFLRLAAYAGLNVTNRSKQA